MKTPKLHNYKYMYFKAKNNIALPVKITCVFNFPCRGIMSSLGWTRTSHGFCAFCGPWTCWFFKSEWWCFFFQNKSHSFLDLTLFWLHENYMRALLAEGGWSLWLRLLLAKANLKHLQAHHYKKTDLKKALDAYRSSKNNHWGYKGLFI